MKLVKSEKSSYNMSPIQLKNKIPKLYLSVAHLKEVQKELPKDYNYNNLIQYPEMGPIIYAPFIFKMPPGHINVDPNLVLIGYEHFQEFFDTKGRRHPNKPLDSKLKSMAHEGFLGRWIRILKFKLGLE